MSGLIQIVRSVTPVTDFSGALASGDLMTGQIEVPNFTRDRGGFALLKSIVLVDLADQKSALDIVFMDRTAASSTLTANAAIAINDADTPNVVGIVNVPAANYFDVGASSVAVVNNINLIMQSKAQSSSLFVLLVSRGSPTYVAATDIVIKFGLEQ